MIGWQNLHKDQPAEQRYSDDWINGIFYGGGGAGWYWTDNLKTQVDFGGGTKGRSVPLRAVRRQRHADNGSSSR